MKKRFHRADGTEKKSQNEIVTCKATLILPRRVVCTNSTVEGSKDYAML